MAVPQRHGITVPFPGVTLADHRPWFEECVALGYTDVWSAEAGGYDGLVPLTLAAAWTPSLRLGTAILPASTRGAATLAGAAASMCEAAPGRFALGIGCSSPTIVTNWNGLPFDRPYARVRDTIRFLRAAFAGEKVTAEYETFSVTGFRLDVAVPSRRPSSSAPCVRRCCGSPVARATGRSPTGAHPTTSRASPPRWGRTVSSSAG